MREISTLEEAKIDKRSPFPRYYQVVQRIKEAIRLGRHLKGDQLPSERKLAEYLGVSRLTIRKALDDLVAEGIIEKEWGKGIYVKNPVTDSLKRTRQIGLTVWHGSEVTYHPVTLEMLRGIGEVLKKRDYDLKIMFITPSMLKRSDYSRILNGDSLDGIILAIQEVPEKKLKEIQNKNQHVIFVNRFHIPNAVVIDFKDASYQITEYLIELGHEKIALINGLKNFEISRQVLSGYEAALDKKGVRVKANLIKNGRYDYQAGFELAGEVLQEGNPTALILADDFMALGAFDAIRKFGLSCPEDVSICSLGEFPFAKFTHPPLTTVRIPFYQLGKVSGENLISLIDSGQIKKQEILTAELMIRQSTGRVRRR